MNDSTYEQRLRTSQLFFKTIQPIQTQISAIQASLRQLKQRQLPQHNLPILGIDETLYLDLLLVGTQGMWPGVTPSQLQVQIRQTDHLLRNYRQYIQNQFGMWAYITSDLTQAIVKQFPNWRFLEIMAGNGYLSAGLKAAGASVYCTDSLAWTAENETGRQLVTPVQPLSAQLAIQKYAQQVDAIIMSWSPNGVPIDYEVLRQLRQLKPRPVLLCLGERFGATNSTEFWQAAKYHNDDRVSQINRYLRPFDLMRDRFYWIN